MGAIPKQSEPTDAYPPRYWWLKRITLASVLLILLLGAIRFWWGRVADRRLQQEIARLHAKSEPILPADFNTPTIPDAENAAYDLNQATAALSSTALPPASTNMVYQPYPPMSDEWWTIARIAVQGNQKSLKFARDARNHDKVDWGLNFKSPVVAILLPMLNQQRALSNLLGDTATYQHLSGNDTDALETIRDIYHQADIIDQQPILVSHLVAAGIRALADEHLQAIAPRLRIEGDPSPFAPTTQPFIPVPATRQQVYALLDVLLDSRQDDAMRRCVQGERMMQLDTIDWMTRDCPVLRPMYQLDEIEAIDRMHQQLAAANQPNWQAAEKASSKAAAPQPPGSTASALSSMFTLNLSGAIQTDFRVRCDRSMTAVSLAAELYRIDHQGKWPTDLKQLVPDYLPRVPIDVFAPDGRPLGYILAKNGSRPVVYSVGPDGKDDTPDESVLPTGPCYGWVSAADQWRDLSQFTPPPPTTQPQVLDYSSQ